MGAENGKNYIRLDNLRKKFREGSQNREVLRGTSAAFKKAELIAILGKSGSGKSTLLNIISGIDEPDKGDIQINGQILTRLDEYQRTLFRRQNIGFVFQFFNLISTLTVFENVSLPLELLGIGLEETKRKTLNILAEVGLADRLETYPERLSGGEQQRVAIARALVHNPLLVLADEPTGNLDEETGVQVLSLLDRLTRQAGKNLIMVTHGKENAIHADRIFELQGGCLNELD